MTPKADPSLPFAPLRVNARDDIVEAGKLVLRLLLVFFLRLILDRIKPIADPADIVSEPKVRLDTVGAVAYVGI